MKKILCLCLSALLAAFCVAGCSEAKSSMASDVGSAVSGAASHVGEAAEDIGEGVTGAVSAVVSEADRMAENGEVSDGDGVIGNEPTDAAGDDMTEETSQPETLYEDTLE